MDKQEFFREASHQRRGPLESVRVLEATTTWAGPMCGCVLADVGADVVQVEDAAGEVARRSPPFLPGTDPPLSFMHATVNRNKRSLSLDLRAPAGREVFLALARRADVVVQSFRPGTMERWGLGYQDLRGLNPSVIYVSISGYGQWGPDHEKVGYDPLAQAASGFLSLNGDPEGEPVKSPTFLADDLAGLHGALAALAALHHRDRCGEGQHVDVSLLDCMLFQSTGYLTLGAMGVELPRLGNDFRIAAPARTFPCRDGSVMAGALLDSQWRRLAEVIGRPELGHDPAFATAPARIARRDQANQLLEEWTRPRSIGEVVERLASAGIPAAPVRSYGQAARDPHVLEREMLQVPEGEGSAGVPLVGPAAKLSRTPTRVRHPAPALGQHNAEILGELGYDAARIRELEESGVL
jgi:crotonobetainyl-CoA:carnitine CoA-transferase CaiB-like acyl-CoA transferase